MNKTRILIAIGAAVLLALFASVGAYKFLSERGRMAEQARLQTAGVVVADLDIPLASTINANQVTVKPWPKGNLPKDDLRRPENGRGQGGAAGVRQRGAHHRIETCPGGTKRQGSCPSRFLRECARLRCR